MTLRRRLPPLNALKAFEATARYQSITKAAEELCVTQAAVSQQVKLLEAYLDVKLLQRQGRHLQLTHDGRAYLPVLNMAFDALAQQTDALFGHHNDQTLTIKTTHSFAENCLAPKLREFTDLHPHIRIKLTTTQSPLPEKNTDADVEIVNGYGDWPDTHAEQLTNDEWVVVAHPSKVTAGQLSISAIAQQPKVASIGYRESWQDWFALAGYEGDIIQPAMAFYGSSLAMRAAESGAGLLLVKKTLVAKALEKGTLVVANSLRLSSSSEHYLITRTDREDCHRVSVFKAWLLNDVMDSVAREI